MKRQRLVLALLVGSGILAAMLITALAAIVSHADSTTQRDAPTTRFYTPDGKSAGSATTYGNTTKFYAPDGRSLGSATRTQGR
jgi:hypothetical protein